MYAAVLSLQRRHRQQVTALIGTSLVKSPECPCPALSRSVAHHMISTRRIAAAFALAAGATALAAPAASAAPISPTGMIDSIAMSGVPAEQQEELPTVTSQLNGLNDLYQLNELHQLTDLAAPVTGLLPAVQ